MDTYFSLVPNDVWYLLLMNIYPTELEYIVSTCPYLLGQTRNPIFGRKYMERWGAEILKRNISYPLLLCRSQEFLHYQGEKRRDKITYCLRISYQLSDLDSIDWIVKTFSCKDIVIFHSPSQSKEARLDLITRMVRAGTSPQELCQSQSSLFAKKIQRLYPSEDYTDWLVQRINNSQKGMALDAIQRGVKFQPTQILSEFVEQNYLMGVKFLLNSQVFSDEVRYLMSTQTGDDVCRHLLTTPGVIQLAIQRQYLSFIFMMLQGNYHADSFSSLYDSSHRSLIQQILDLNDCRSPTRQLPTEIITRLRIFL